MNRLQSFYKDLVDSPAWPQNEISEYTWAVRDFASQLGEHIYDLSMQLKRANIALQIGKDRKEIVSGTPDSDRRASPLLTQTQAHPAPRSAKCRQAGRLHADHVATATQDEPRRSRHEGHHRHHPGVPSHDLRLHLLQHGRGQIPVRRQSGRFQWDRHKQGTRIHLGFGEILHHLHPAHVVDFSVCV
jgi:hypothetical protein